MTALKRWFHLNVHNRAYQEGVSEAKRGQGTRGSVMRALASHQCGPGSSPGIICGLRLLLVLSFAPRDFPPGTPVFSSFQKPAFPNSNSTRNRVDEEPPRGSATAKSLFILFKKYSYISLKE